MILPTYREAGCIARVLEDLEAARARVYEEFGFELGVVIVNDESGDDLQSVVAGCGYSWVSVLNRTGETRSLAGAVMAGVEASEREGASDFVGVMDADGSHPGAAIVDMLRLLIAANGPEMVFASRFCAGADAGVDRTLLRDMNTRAATWMARPFARISDPMSGYFLMRWAVLERARKNGLAARGYKIGLEILVRSGCREVGEVPIRFGPRLWGSSKLSVGVRLAYVWQVLALWRLKGRRGGRHDA